MTSAHHDESGDDTASSLGDSSYDFIDDRSNVTTDDEDQDAMTASTTSSSGQAFEQVDVPLPQDGSSDDGGQQSQDKASARAGTQEASPGSVAVSPSQKSKENEDVESKASDDHDPIEFDEPSVINLNSSSFTEVSHTLEISGKQDIPTRPHQIAPHHHHDQVAVTVRQTMTSHSLIPDDGQYRILYVGDTAARESIIQKIGTALAADLKRSMVASERSRSSRFSIVPISAFGEDSSPEVVLIDSSGLDLTVEDCSYASFTKKQNGNDVLCVELASGIQVESTWGGLGFAISNGWRLPDIAVFYLADNESLAMKMTRQSARAFMNRHKVPSVTISQSALWKRQLTEPITIDYLTPHVCLESRNKSVANARIVRRFPIDLTTFVNIDAGQMNRNLACLATASSSSKSRNTHRQNPDGKPKDKISNGPWSFRGLCQSLIYDVRNDGLLGLNRYEYISGLAVMLMSVLITLVIGFGLTELLGASRVLNSRVFSPTHNEGLSHASYWMSTTSSTIPPSLSNTPTAIASSALSTSTQLVSAKTSSSNTDLAAFLLDAYTLAPNRSEQFKVHVLGDCHIVLRPPHWLSKMRKGPRLFFTVMRGNTELEHQTTSLFDGVFALQLPRENAHGAMTVKVWTETKPIVNEKFEVDFGSSWLKVAGWKRATRAVTETFRGDLQFVQTGLSTVYDDTKKGLSTLVRQRRKNAVAQGEADKAVLKSHFKAAVKTMALIVTQTRDLQRGLAIQWYATRAVASNGIRDTAQKISKDLTLYTYMKSSAVSQQAHLIVHSTTSHRIKTWAKGVKMLGRSHTRNMQKKALKIWWKVRGLPKEN